MATFLDQKEQVLNIELTKHGRKCLGLGIFEPEYYHFFDDTIIYDNKYAGIADETSNLIKTRILDESLTISSMNNLKDVLPEPLGDSNIFSDSAPAWNLQFLNGSIKTFHSSSSSYFQNEFTLNNITYNISLKDKNYTFFSNNNVSEYDFGDEVIQVDDDYILIDLSEFNVDDNNENFEIELITYDEKKGKNSTEKERKLLFIQKQTNIIDGIIYEESEMPMLFNELKIDEKDANYYYDILVDGEIDQAIINKTAKPIQEQAKELYKTVFEGVVGREPCK